MQLATCSDSVRYFRKSVIPLFMPSNFSFFSRRVPDNVTEELVAALSGSKTYEFKALFSVIHAALRARRAASGGEEMLRLRTYEKLQNLVRQGQVKENRQRIQGRDQGPAPSERESEGVPKERSVLFPQAVARFVANESRR